MPTGTGIKKVSRVVLINGLLTLGLLFVIELGVRVLVPEISSTGTDSILFVDRQTTPQRILRPQAKGKSHGVEFMVDDDGFWRYSGNQPSNHDALLLLGDSVTMGIGVQPDSTLGGRLAERLQKNVLNPSIIGYNSVDYRSILVGLGSDSTGLPTTPSVSHVILVWCLNDVYSSINMLQSRPPGTGRPDMVNRILLWSQRNLRTYQWIKSIALDRAATYYEYDAQFYQTGSAEFEDALSNIVASAETLENAKIGFTVVLAPYEYQIRKKVTQPQDDFAFRLSENGINVLNPLPYLLDSGIRSSELFLYGDGIHYSSRGHQVMAQYILDNSSLLNE